MACALEQKLTKEIASKIQMLATCSPTASCFYTADPNDDHEQYILQNWEDSNEDGSFIETDHKRERRFKRAAKYWEKHIEYMTIFWQYTDYKTYMES